MMRDRKPRWLNWTTVRGAALFVAGTVIMASPRHERLTVAVVAVLFVAWALGEVWFALVGRAGGKLSVPALRILMGLALVVAAVMLLVDSIPFSVVIGSVLVVRGLILAVRSVPAGGRGTLGSGSAQERTRQADLLSAALWTVTGVVVVVVPDTAILAVRAGLGLGCMALGALMLNLGLGRGQTQGTRDPEVRRAGWMPFDHSTAPALVNRWLRSRRLAPDTRQELVDALFFEPPNQAAKLAAFWVMMVLATGIATFALIQDSTAVVIGAMLVAPLMGPIMGVSAAAVNGWAARLVRSLVLVVLAAGAAVFVAWLIASWLPSVGDISTNTQITSRIEPSLLDFCIAVFAGAAGAYATVDPRVSSSLSGVAVAVALVPPLAVVGITLQQGEYESALGATLLFSTNVVSIVLAAVTVFVFMGFAALPPDRDQRERLRRVIGVFGAGALVILMPLSITSQDLWTEAANEGHAQAVIDDWLPTDGSVEFLGVDSEGEQLSVTLSGEAVPTDTADLLDDLQAKLGFRPKVTVRLVPSQITELD